MNGTLALVGGREFTEGCTFDAGARRGCAARCCCCPSAAGVREPAAAIERAIEWFAPIGVTVRVLEVYRRAEAMEPAVGRGRPPRPRSST